MSMRNRGFRSAEQKKCSDESHFDAKTPSNGDNDKSRERRENTVRRILGNKISQGCLLIILAYNVISGGIIAEFKTADEARSKLTSFVATNMNDSSRSSILEHIKTTRASIASLANFPVSKDKETRRPGRFPKYGTKEFAQQCNWTVPAPDSPDPECAYLARPPPKSHEGISDWASGVTTSYLMARQLGCKMYVDYGKDVDIHSVVTIFPDIHPLHNWTTPAHLANKFTGNSARSLQGWNNTKMGRRARNVDAPKYRYSMGGLTRQYIYEDDFPDLKKNLPGFNLETGMACVLGNIFNLSPTAANYEPQLFTEILPALHDENALVIALNVRTNRADLMADKEKLNATVPKERKVRSQKSFTSFVNKSFCIEERYLSGIEEPDLDISQVVWIILSDGQEVKRSFQERYDGKDANARLPEESRKWKSKVIPRKILYTKARGIHTRPERSPSTQDFAEAFIDWYLIGESDAVVVESVSSFGPTAAMRTHRPLYRTHKGNNYVCDEPIPAIRKRIPEVEVTSKASNNKNKNAVKTVLRNNKRLQKEEALPVLNSHRFPSYGTPSFRDECSWTELEMYNNDPKCIIYFAPKTSSEGLSWFMSELASQYIMAKQAGCQLYFSYGLHQRSKIDMSQVILPHTDSVSPNNWTVPTGFECLEEEHCYIIPIDTNHLRSKPYIPVPAFSEVPGRKPLKSVPRYRYAYFILGDKFLYNDMFLDLKDVLPGFKVETGMACALASLFRLSPKVSQFEPRLFSSIFPKLHDPDSLVISIYIRTGKADMAAEKNGITLKGQSTLDCAMSVEKLISISQKRIVWMVVSDSPALKQEIVKSYNNTSVDVGNTHSNITREILVTGAEGLHTKGASPSMQSFGEAFIDWYLIGESNVVVSSQDSTFGTTAALRSNLPVYETRKCKQRTLIHQRIEKKH